MIKGDDALEGVKAQTTASSSVVVVGGKSLGGGRASVKE